MPFSFPLLWQFLKYRLHHFIKSHTQPATTALALSALADLTRSKADLITENALLRQQLIVLKRHVKRPQLTSGDRFRLALLASWTPFWKQALHIIQPDTLLRWHRDLFRQYWQRKSKSKGRKPRIALETITLIKKMAQENRSWGAERIRGELLKLGIRVSKRTVQRHLPNNRSKTGQNWATFLKNHAGDIWACDFTVVHDLFFRPLYIFVIIELQSRRIIHHATTRNPTGFWTAQQLREATPWGKAPKFLIHDRDSKFGALFFALAAATNIEQLVTPFQAPKANSICERFIGSLKRECLDHRFILHQHHLRKAVAEYTRYYNHSRPHQGIQQRVPARQPDNFPLSGYPTGKVISTPVLGGLHHTYAWKAYPN